MEVVVPFCTAENLQLQILVSNKSGLILKGFHHKGVSVSRNALLLSLNSGYFIRIFKYRFKRTNMCTVEKGSKKSAQMSEYKYLNFLLSLLSSIYFQLNALKPFFHHEGKLRVNETIVLFFLVLASTQSRQISKTYKMHLSIFQKWLDVVIVLRDHCFDLQGDKKEENTLESSV